MREKAESEGLGDCSIRGLDREGVKGNVGSGGGGERCDCGGREWARTPMQINLGVSLVDDVIDPEKDGRPSSEALVTRDPVMEDRGEATGGVCVEP